MASRSTLALFALTVGSLLASTPAAGQPLDAPAIRPGDFWTYLTNTSFVEGFFLDGTATFAIEARDAIEVDGVVHDAFRVLASGVGRAGGTIPSQIGPVPVSGTWDLVGVEILEAEGLKLVSSFLELLALGETAPIGQPFALRVRNSTTLGILEDTWRFPLDVRAEGHVTSSFRTWENVTFTYGSFGGPPSNLTGEGQRTLSYRLEARVSIDVPAGRFEAYRINETWPDGRYSHLFFAPAVGNNARTDSYDETGSRVATTELAAYRYQALETPTYLGLTPVQWALMAPASGAGIAGVAWFLARGRRQRKSGPPG